MWQDKLLRLIHPPGQVPLSSPSSVWEGGRSIVLASLSGLTWLLLNSSAGMVALAVLPPAGSQVESTAIAPLQVESSPIEPLQIEPLQIEQQTADLEGAAYTLPPPDVFVPPYPSFNSQRLDQQLQVYAEYLRRFGAPDVLIVGSSRSLQGVDPVVLQQALAAQGQGGLKIYNFGINGATARVIDLLLRRILLPEQLPRLLIWADGSRAFNSGRADITYNGIASSEGYRQLASGVPPIRVPVPVEISIAPSSQCLELPPGGLVENSLPPSNPSAIVSRDVRYAPFSGSLVTDPGSSLRSPRRLICPPERSLSPTHATVPLRAPLTTDLDSTGFLPVPIRFDPATYYQTHPRVSGRYDTNYVPFQLGGEQSTATIAVARLAGDRQIPLVFVNLPLTQDYLDPVRQDYEQRFRQHMQQLASREGFLFRDLSLRWTTQNDYFADPSHLNQYGARAVAQQLAIDPAIPWQRARPTETP
jgi:hypothetical protein